MDSPKPITRLEWVERRLRDAIVAGELRPGQRLKTEELATEWGVSPTPIRESYQRLSAEGLVELIPQRGARVSQISMQEATEIYEIRLRLEPYALRQSLQRRDANWERNLRDTFATLRAVLKESPHEISAFESAHRAFDEALLAGYESSWFARIIGTLRDHSARYRILSFESKGGAPQVLHEHEELYKACLNGDTEEAVEIFTRHIGRTIESFRRTWAAQPTEASRSTPS